LAILVVDDDKEINLLINKYLSVEGYKVDSAFDGRQALEFFKNKEYDLVITDVMMSPVDGFELVEKIREKDKEVLIIFLTAKDSEVERVLGFKLGADDYVVKPFFMNELVARVNARLKRYSQNQNRDSEILEYDDLYIDIPAVKVLKYGKEISLRAKEFELLVFLAKNNGRVFSKGQIFENVWGEEYLSDDNTVMVHIRRLRTKIETDPEKPEYIKTIWGLGYKFEGDLE